MDWEQFFKENPSAQMQLDAQLKKAGEDAVVALRESQKVVMPFVASDIYPGPIRALAVEVLAGLADISGLKAAVAMYDSSEEGKKAAAARKVAADAGETPAAGSPAGDFTDNVIRTEEDRVAALAKLKAVV